MGGKGNEGVNNYVTHQGRRSATWEYAYAKQNKIAHAAGENQAGSFVRPDDLTFKAAAANASWKAADGFIKS